MPQPERSYDDLSASDTPATPPQVLDLGREKPPDAGDIVRRNQARYDHHQQCYELNCQRHEIFSEWLATPIRPARDKWFSAWRLVADGAASDDLDAVVNGIQAAATAFAEMDSVFSQWFRRAREWRRIANAIHPAFNGLIGFDTLETFAEWDSERRACLPALMAVKQDFFDWAFAVERLEALRRLHGQTSFLHCSLFVVPGRCLDLVALVMAEPSADQIRDFLKATRGPSWLAGLTGMLAVVVGPLLPDDVFSPADLPADDRQRNAARYLAKLTVHTFGQDGQGVRFARQYFPLPPSPPLAPMELLSWDEVSGGDTDAPDLGECEPVPPAPDAVKPVWNPEERVLTFGTWRFEYGKSAPSQEKILAAFQAADWPSAVRKSLPGNLSSVLQNMRSKLGTECPISFDADGAGGVRWQLK